MDNHIYSYIYTYIYCVILSFIHNYIFYTMDSIPCNSIPFPFIIHCNPTEFHVLTSWIDPPRGQSMT